MSRAWWEFLNMMSFQAFWFGTTTSTCALCHRLWPNRFSSIWTKEGG